MIVVSTSWLLLEIASCAATSPTKPPSPPSIPASYSVKVFSLTECFTQLLVPMPSH
jgi:hypothetical protein